MTEPLPNFSVLLSIYVNETPSNFNRAMQSIWDDQTVKPTEIILVQDGTLTEQLYETIAIWKKKLNNIFKIIQLKKNKGLGYALNTGLERCSFEIIARMDTDDISRENRFEKQIEILRNNNIDICSSWVTEFEGNSTVVTSSRKVPKTHSLIYKYAKKRNPINHPAAMFKKKAVLKAGGYKEMLWFEDYYLWVRMLKCGCKFYNIQEPLVNMRAGAAQLQRRSGLEYAIKEYTFQKKLLDIGFLNKIEFLRNILLRLTIRIIPKKMISLIYHKILRA